MDLQISIYRFYIYIYICYNIGFIQGGFPRFFWWCFGITGSDTCHRCCIKAAGPSEWQEICSRGEGETRCYWANYSDLSSRHTPNGRLVREVSPKSIWFRFRNYRNLPRFLIGSWRENLELKFKNQQLHTHHVTELGEFNCFFLFRWRKFFPMKSPGSQNCGSLPKHRGVFSFGIFPQVEVARFVSKNILAGFVVILCRNSGTNQSWFFVKLLFFCVQKNPVSNLEVWWPFKGNSNDLVLSFVGLVHSASISPTNSTNFNGRRHPRNTKSTAFFQSPMYVNKNCHHQLLFSPNSSVYSWCFQSSSVSFLQNFKKALCRFQPTLLPIEALSPTATSPTSGSGPVLGIVPSPGAIVTVQQSWHAVQAVFKWGDWKLQKKVVCLEKVFFFVSKATYFITKFSILFFFGMFWFSLLEMDDPVESFLLCYMLLKWSIPEMAVHLYEKDFHLKY